MHIVVFVKAYFNITIQLVLNKWNLQGDTKEKLTKKAGYG